MNTSQAAAHPGRANAKPLWKQVAIPTEHGGWSLTGEPILLGLLVAFSLPGLFIGLGAMLGFIARTPLKVVLVDRWRSRKLERTRLASKIAAREITLIIVFAILALALAPSFKFLIPLLVALPLIVTELWFDMRSRSRQLIPELAGAVGMGSVASAIALAAEVASPIAFGLWVILAARALAAIPYARNQVFRAHNRKFQAWHSDLAQLIALVMALLAWLFGLLPFAPVVAIFVLACFNIVTLRTALRPVKVVGFQQLGFGLAVIVVTVISLAIA